MLGRRLTKKRAVQKNMKVNGHERQRSHALILVHQGYSYREVGQILLVDKGRSGIY
jgi:hypothetical protein